MKNVGLSRDEVIANFAQWIAPKYNGNQDLKPVLVKIIDLPSKKKFHYGIRFETNPIIGQVQKGEGMVEIEIMEIL